MGTPNPGRIWTIVCVSGAPPAYVIALVLAVFPFAVVAFAVYVTRRRSPRLSETAQSTGVVTFAKVQMCELVRAFMRHGMILGAAPT
jgi:heme/copper-type cytochrome/quinol oxidase subunit 4